MRVFGTKAQAHAQASMPSRMCAAHHRFATIRFSAPPSAIPESLTPETTASAGSESLIGSPAIPHYRSDTFRIGSDVAVRVLPESPVDHSQQTKPAFPSSKRNSLLASNHAVHRFFETDAGAADLRANRTVGRLQDFRDLRCRKALNVPQRHRDPFLLRKA